MSLSFGSSDSDSSSGPWSGVQNFLTGAYQSAGGDGGPIDLTNYLNGQGLGYGYFNNGGYGAPESRTSYGYAPGTTTDTGYITSGSGSGRYDSTKSTAQSGTQMGSFGKPTSTTQAAPATTSAPAQTQTQTQPTTNQKIAVGPKPATMGATTQTPAVGTSGVRQQTPTRPQGGMQMKPMQQPKQNMSTQVMPQQPKMVKPAATSTIPSTGGVSSFTNTDTAAPATTTTTTTPTTSGVSSGTGVTTTSTPVVGTSGVASKTSSSTSTSTGVPDLTTVPFSSEYDPTGTLDWTEDPVDSGPTGPTTESNQNKGLVDIPMQYYPWETVAPQNDIQKMAQTDAYWKYKNGNQNLDMSNDFVGDILNGQYMGTNPAYTTLGEIASGSRTNPAIEGYNNLLKEVHTDNPAYSSAKNTADGGYLGKDPLSGYEDKYADSSKISEDNPAYDYLNSVTSGDYLSSDTNETLNDYYDSMAENTIENYNETTAQELSDSALSSGAFGGSRHGVAEGQAYGELSDSLSDLSSSVYYDNYSKERDRQQSAADSLSKVGSSSVQNALSYLGDMNKAWSGERQNMTNATSQMSDIYNSAKNRNLQAISGLGNTYNQDVANQLQAATGMGQLYNTDLDRMMSATNSAMNLDQYDWSNIDRMTSLGSQLQNYDQSLINAEKDRWDWWQNEPWDRLAKAMGIYNGVPTQSSQSDSSNFSAGLGLADMKK